MSQKSNDNPNSSTHSKKKLICAGLSEKLELINKNYADKRIEIED